MGGFVHSTFLDAGELDFVTIFREKSAIVEGV
jgi:hypothetical protein